ncbi:hypothetical protein JXQ31_20260, partial [candidate division KSB1 bacterium]|nr:hypothetical protein [candidate division KSB1 bacterium]
MGEKTKRKTILIFICIVIIFSVVALSITLVLYATKFNAGLADDQVIWSYFGDYLGGVLGPVFTFLTIIILVVTLYYQREELELTRQELHNSTEQQKRSATALETQMESLKLQNQVIYEQTFDTTFFNLLNNLSDYYENLTLEIGLDRGNLRDYPSNVALDRLIDMIENKIMIRTQKNVQIVIKDIITESLNDESIYKLLEIDGYINEILKFIDKEKITNKEKYIRILYLHIKFNKLKLFYYMSYMKNNKKIIEKYALFKDLNYKFLKNAYGNLVDYFSPAAYG